MLISKIRHDWPEKAGFLISRPHGHPQYTFLHFSTQVQLRINDEIIDAPPGSCIFYAPREPQWFYAPQELLHNWFHADTALGPLLERFEIPVNRLLYLTNTSFISEDFHRMEAEYFSENPYQDSLMDSYLQAFLITFSRALKGISTVQYAVRDDRIQLRKLRKQILTQPETKWTVEQMAEIANLSPSRFHNVYKATFGSTPMRDLIEARVDYGKTLLLSAQKFPLPVIAECLGYNDQYHFIRQFKTVTGMTPGTYRKLHR